MAAVKLPGVLATVREGVDVRCPPESRTDVILSLFNSARSKSESTVRERIAGMLTVAMGDPPLAAAALAAVVRTGKLSWLDREADKEALACLPDFTRHIGALLRRPGLTEELHAAEPYAAASLVTSVLRSTRVMPGTPGAEERRTETLGQFRSSAGHCLGLVKGGLLQPRRQMEKPPLALSMVAHLAAHHAASLPAGSGEQLADIVAYCQSLILTKDALPDAATLASGEVTPYTLAHRVLTTALLALGSFYKVQPLTPIVAAAALQAVDTLVTSAVHCLRPLEPEWATLYSVPLVEGALLGAPDESIGAFLTGLCSALQNHFLPGPSSNPDKQVLNNLVTVTDLLSTHTEEVAYCLEPRAASKFGNRSGSKPASIGSKGKHISILHAAPLQTRWQEALAAALLRMLPWLAVLPADGELADKLFTAATRLAGPAADALQAAAGGADPAAALGRPSALALAGALQSYLDVPLEHVECALRRGPARPDAAALTIGTTRAAAAALGALASATAEATAAAEAAGRPLPSEPLLWCGCNAAVAPHMRLVFAERDYQATDAFRGQRRDMDAMLQAPALITKLHGSGATARSMLDRQGAAAFLANVVYQGLQPADIPVDHKGGNMPVLQAACKALALLVTSSSAAKQQCMSAGVQGRPPWPKLAAAMRLDLRGLPARARMLGEKALQQVDLALQGGQQAHKADGGRGASDVPQRSQADADLAMRSLLEEEEHTSSKASKAAQKRARKKAAAKQAAGAAAATAAAPPAATAADAGQQQPPVSCPNDTQTQSAEPSSSTVAADVQKLRLDAPAVVHSSVAPAIPAGHQSADDWMMCPISKAVMDDPVMCSDGHTYSRAAITAWLAAKGPVSPMTDQPLARQELIPNHALRNTIEAVLQLKARDG